MVIYHFQGKDFYIDGRLKEQIDKKIIPDLARNDKDVVFLIDGGERKGKSKFADLLCGYAASQLGCDYGIDNFCMTPTEFRERVENCPPKSIVIYDEAHRGMASGRTLTEINNILKDLMMEMGQKNLFVCVVMPTFFLLDKYAALFRARGLFHIYELKGRRGFWVYYNEKAKLKLYIRGKKELNYNCMHFPKFRGKFYNQYVVDEVLYRVKKAKSFKDKPRITKSEVYQDERDKMLYILYAEAEFTIPKLEKLFKFYKIPLKHSTIGEIIHKFDGKDDKNSDSAEKSIL